MKTYKSLSRYWFVDIFALILLIPCMLFLTACGDDPKAEQQSQEATLKDNAITISVDSNNVYNGQPVVATATATSGQTPTMYVQMNLKD